MMMMEQVCFHFCYFDAAKIMKLFKTTHKRDIFSDSIPAIDFSLLSENAR